MPTTKSKGLNQRVVPYGKKWAIKKQGSEKATALFDTKEEALARAKQISKKYGSKVLSHRENGTLSTSTKTRGSTSSKRKHVKRTTTKTSTKKSAAKNTTAKKSTTRGKIAVKKTTTRKKPAANKSTTKKKPVKTTKVKRPAVIKKKKTPTKKPVKKTTTFKKPSKKKPWWKLF